MSEFDDKPIDSPEEDKFGFKALAATIAESISKLAAPEGTVIAINGLWGSGKSSFINLVRHHLCDKTKDGDLKIVDFKCWWFRGQEALTIAFFHELYSAMKPNIGEQAKKIIPKLVPQLLIGASPVVDSVAGMPGSILTAFKIITSIAKHIKQDETVEKLHKELSDALNQGSKRYLVIIDDIDRLSPDEAMLIFRLIKSVGGLPNIMYLLAYDRQLAEKIVTERYPSEGPHYLEKIVQASFELPEPSRVSLENEFLSRLDSVIEERGYKDGEYFRNLFDEIIAPEIKTPRDLIRILNPLKVTWPAVKGEVNVTDFLCIETLRVKRPELYYALRANKDHLTRTESGEAAMERGYHSPSPSKDPSTQPYKHPQAQTYENIFLKRESEVEREKLRRGLMLLFPALARIWSPNNYRDDDPDTWDHQRRVCSPKHFDTYFRFALQDDVLSSGEIKELITGARDPEFIRQSLLDASQRELPNGDTKASLLLDALNVHADEISDDQVESLLKAVYSIADNLAPLDPLWRASLRRLEKLTYTLTKPRFSLEERSRIVLNASAEATLGWLGYLASWPYGNWFGSSENWPYGDPTLPLENMPETLWLTTREHASKIKDRFIVRIEAADDGSLINCPYLGCVLLGWRKNADKTRVRAWVSTVLEKDVAVTRLATAFTLISLETFPGRSYTALTDELELVVGLNEFLNRATEVKNAGTLDKKDHVNLAIFLEAWRKQENRNNNAEDK